MKIATTTVNIQTKKEKKVILQIALEFTPYLFLYVLKFDNMKIDIFKKESINIKRCAVPLQLTKKIAVPWLSHVFTDSKF